MYKQILVETGYFIVKNKIIINFVYELKMLCYIKTYHYSTNIYFYLYWHDSVLNIEIINKPKIFCLSSYLCCHNLYVLYRNYLSYV